MTQTRASINQNRNAAISSLDRQIADLNGVIAALQTARTALFIWSSSAAEEEPLDLEPVASNRRTIKELAAKMAGNGQ